MTKNWKVFPQTFPKDRLPGKIITSKTFAFIDQLDEESIKILKLKEKENFNHYIT